MMPKKFDVERIRQDFPILQRTVHGKKLVYLDNAATTQKPNAVIDAVSDYYRTMNANVHRGIHSLSEQATSAYEAARGKVRDFLHADSIKEIVFVRGVTEAINLVAYSLGELLKIGKGDEILISAMEHHSNIVPWQLLCERRGAELRVIPITEAGEIDEGAYKALLSERVKLVSLVHASNTLGTWNPVEKWIQWAHELNIPVLLDGAQAVPHFPVDVQKLDCDFYTFSGHKLFSPTGIGVLYGKERYLEDMPPFQGGGDMIRSVSFAKTTYNDLPYKFEAGTPNIAGAIGLGKAIDYISSIGISNIVSYEHSLLQYATSLLSRIEGIKIIGNPQKKVGVISFVCDGVHPHDVGTILDQEGIAIRTGHHCTQPLLQRLGLTATARISFSFYNTKAEIDYFCATIPHIFQVFS